MICCGVFGLCWIAYDVCLLLCLCLFAYWFVDGAFALFVVLIVLFVSILFTWVGLTRCVLLWWVVCLPVAVLCTFDAFDLG